MFPNDLWNLLIYIPFLSGVLITAIADGRSGLKTFFSRMVRWRVGLKWYAVALFLPLLLMLVAFGLNIASGATLSPNAQLPAWPDLLSVFVIESFLIIALGEEPGFRGFALPRLLAGRTALAASLILGVLHSIWHIPLFIFGGDTPIIIVMVIEVAFRADQTAYPPPGQLVDIGGRRIHMIVQGNETGRPTVLVEAGMAAFSSNWGSCSRSGVSQ